MRRSRLEIVLDILSVIMGGVDKPTPIMYAANMSWSPVQRMLSNLVEQGFLLVVLYTKGRQSRRRYQITEKGVNVLDYFEKVEELIPLADI